MELASDIVVSSALLLSVENPFYFAGQVSESRVSGAIRSQKAAEEGRESVSDAGGGYDSEAGGRSKSSAIHRACGCGSDTQPSQASSSY